MDPHKMDLFASAMDKVATAVTISYFAKPTDPHERIVSRATKNAILALL
jgi:hypothetical protein